MMKSNMRACGTRIIAFSLLLTLVIGMLPINAFATNSVFHKQTMTLNSNVSSEVSVELYEHENMFYISIEDMGKLTRCQVKTDGDCITVQQGFNSGTFDYSDQSYSDMYNDVSFDILRISDGKFAVPALIFLNYFGATAFLCGDTLFAFMPVCTAWEALDINYSNTLLNLNDVYNVEAHLWWDLINELLIGEMKSEAGYMRDAYNAVMDVVMEENEAVQQYVDAAYGDLSTYLHSEKGSDLLNSVLDTIETETDIADKAVDPLLFEPAYLITKVYYNLEQKNLIRQAMDMHETFPDMDLSPIGEQFSENVHRRIETDKLVENIGDKVDLTLSCVSYGVSVAQSIKRVHDADNIVYTVMGQENMNNLGITAANDQWTVVADSYKNHTSIALSELVLKAEEKLVGDKSEEALAAILDLMSGTKGAGKLGLELGRLILELDPIANKQNDAIRAEIIAILLSELQFEVASILKANLENIVSEPRNPDYYKQYIDTQMMYCRTSIAMYNSLIEVVRTLTWKGEDIVELFQKKVDLLSLYMYRLTTLQYDNYQKCIPMDLGAVAKAESDINSFITVIEDVQKNISYDDYSESQKEYCRGEFFELEDKKALVLLYRTWQGSVLDPGYYVGLWVENADGTISCLTNALLDEVNNSDDAYVYVAIREIHGKLYLNPCLRTTQNNTDISKNQYYCIDDTLELEYDLYSEAPFVSMGNGLIQHDESKAKYFLNQEKVSEQAFYGLQDELNYNNIVIDLCPFSSEGQNPQGKTFEYLLEQIAKTEAYELIYDDGGGLTDGDVNETTDVFVGTLQEFIEQKGYQSFWNVEFEGLGVLPEEYGLIDLDQDDNDELIVCGYESGKQWAFFLLFEYSPSRNEVTRVTIETPETYDFSPGYCFMVDRYSPEYQALVISPFRYTQMTALFEFWTKENGVLYLLMDVGWDTDENGKYFFANGERCSEKTKDEYLNTGTVRIEFIPLP